MKLSSSLPTQTLGHSGPTTPSPAQSGSSAVSASTPPAPVASPAVPPGRMADLVEVPLVSHLAAVPELMAIREKLLAGLVERQRDGMERCARYLERVKPGGPEYEDTRRRLKALRSLLAERRSSPTELFDLAKLEVELDLIAPEFHLNVWPPEGAPLRLVECEEFGWLAIHIEAEPLQILLRERLEVWGHMAGHEVSVRPMGRSVLVPVDGGKADWWAWAAQQAERLLVPC